MKFSRDAAISRIPAPHLLKQGQLQLAGASFRDMLSWRLDERVSTNTPVETGRVDQWHGLARAPSVAQERHSHRKNFKVRTLQQH